MNSERVFNIILADLALEKMKLEEDLERTINTDMDINIKVEKVKNFINKLSMTELSIVKFTGMLNVNNNNKQN
jgi:hypothetical protein